MDIGKKHRTIAWMLVICLWVTLLPEITFAKEKQSAKEPKSKASQQQTIAPEHVTEKNVIEAEKTTDTTTYDLGGSKKMTVFHGGEVRYEKEKGKLVDYDPSLVKIKEGEKTQQHQALKGYAYENKEGDKKQYLPEKLSEDTPILMEHDNYQIRFAPTDSTMQQAKTAQEPIEVEKETIPTIYEGKETMPVNAVYGSDSKEATLTYTSGEHGVKETLTLAKKPENNTFQYKLSLKGLRPRKNSMDEGITFYDKETGDIVGDISAPWMNDASGNAYSEAITYDMKKDADSEDTYLLTMAIDKSYLNDAARQYPVTIDPSTTWTGSTKVKDAYIISGSKYGNINFYDSGTKIMPAGKNSTGTHRTCIQFTDIKKTIKGQSVSSAKLTVYETGSGASKQSVGIHRVKETWSPGSVTWNKRPAFVATAYDTITTKKTAKTAHSFNVLSYAKALANDSIPSYGLILNNNTAAPSYACFYGSRAAESAYRPKLAVTYYSVPSTASSASIAPTVAKNGQAKISYAGISSTGLNRVEYRVNTYNSSTKAQTAYWGYTASRKIASGGVLPTLPDGTYVFYVRGVNTAGVAGGERATNVVRIDSTAPVIGSLKAKAQDADISGKWTSETDPAIHFENLTDAGSGVNKAGFSYAITKKGAAAPAAAAYKTLTAQNSALSVSTASPYSGSFKLLDADKKLATGQYVIYVKAKDAAGNEAVKSVEYWKDADDPTGSITITEQGTGAQTTKLKGTVNIVAAIDGTGSPVKRADLNLYRLKKGVDKDGSETMTEEEKPAKTIFENVTLSTNRDVETNVDSDELENGPYRLKLEIEDEVSHKTTVTKDVKIANPIAKPEITVRHSKASPVQVSWKFPETAKVKALSYKLPDSDKWQAVPGSAKAEGSFSLELPQKNGKYDVAFRGIDIYDIEGEQTIAPCIIDTMAPTAKLASFYQGTLKGTVKDDHLKGWEVLYKEQGAADNTYKQIFKGTEAVDHDKLGFIDLTKSEFSPDHDYTLMLRATDQAGNESRDTCNIYIPKDENIGKEIPAVFAVQRPAGQSYTDESFILKTKTTKLALKELEENALKGETSTWYIDNRKVAQGAAFEDDFSTLSKDGKPAKYEENKAYRVFVISKNENGGRSYSRTVTKNGILQQVVFDKPAVNGVSEKEIKLSQEAVSFRMSANTQTLDGKALAYQVKVGDGSYKAVEAGRTYYISDFTETAYTGALTVKATAEGAGNSLNVGKTQFNFDTVEKESFKLSKLENYVPETVAVKDKINYKTYVYWDNLITDSKEDQDISYEVHRGTKKDFVPSEENLAASDIRAGYFSEINVNYGGNFYYRVRTVRKDSKGKVTAASSYSKCVGSKVIDGNEYTKRMGLKDYWKYAKTETPNGTAYIEKSAGNFVYQQKDAEIPNEQLEVELTRSYNSKSSAKSAFGLGWTHDFDMELLSICDKDAVDFDNVILKDGSGTIYHFIKQADGTYVSSLGKYIVMKKEEKSEAVKLPEKKVGVAAGNQMKTVTVNSSYTLTTKDNIEYRFNSGGQMVYQGEPNGNFLLFEYDQKIGLLTKVVTSKNIAMEFEYNSDDYNEDNLLVKRMKLPDGSVTSYEYKSTQEDTNSLLTNVTETSKDGETITYEYQYDRSDKPNISMIKDAEGNRYQIRYAEKGDKAVSMVYPDGESIELAFNGDDSTTTKKIVKGNVVSEETDSFNYYGNCVKSIDAEGYESVYEYQNDLLHKTTSQVDGRYVDDSGYVRAPQTKQTKTETVNYDKEDNPTQEVEEDGTKTTYTYNGDGAGEIKDDLTKSEKEVDGDGKVVTNESYQYDEEGNIKESYDDVAKTRIRTTYFAKDDPEKGQVKGEVEKEEEFSVKDDGSEKLQSTTTYSYKYDEAGNKTETTTQTIGGDVIKNITDTDVMGREVRKEDRGKIDTNQYDGFGRLIKTDASETGDDGKTIHSTVSKAYDKNGSLVKEVDEEGLETHYEYDEMNRLTREWLIKDGETLKTELTSYSYENVEINTGKGKQQVKNAFVTTVKIPEKNGGLLTPAYKEEKTYQDALGRTVREYKNGIYTDMTYDGQGNIITRFELGELAKSEDEGMLTVFLYDTAGNQTHTIQNPVYDKAQNAFAIDKEKTIAESKAYDSSGNVIEEKDGKGNVTKFTYDAEGNIKTVTQPDGSVTSYDYNVEQPDGTTATVTTDALGQKSIVKTDDSDREVEISDLGKGDGQAPITTNFAYDKKDNKIKETDSEGNYRTFAYDGRDRLKTVDYFDKNKTETMRTIYTYDLTDNITSMADYKVTGGNAALYRYTKYKYDKQKRLIGFAECDGASALTADGKENSNVINSKMMNFTYDADDNLTDIAYPETGSKVKGVSFNYNRNTKWLETVNAKTDEGEKLLREYTYTSDNKVATMKDHRNFLKGGSDYTLHKYSYDAFDRPVKVEYYDSSDLTNAKEVYTYTFDKNNNITSEKLKNDYPEDGQKVDEDRSYTFDILDRLVDTQITDRANKKNEKIQYSYDKVGNRLKEKKNDTTTNFTYNSLNQLTGSKETKNADNSTKSNKVYQYDKNGNQISENDSVTGESKHMTYDADNRLGVYTAKKGNAVTLTQTNLYNGEGKRIRKSETDSKETKTINYYYQNDSVLYTTDDDSKTTAFNVMGAEDNVIATARNAGSKDEAYYFYNKDVRKSTTNVLDTAGKGIVSYKYSDYGETTINGNADFYNEICYTGGIYDRSTELYYLNARFYNPEDAVFMNQDTDRGEDNDPSSQNLYAYCANNPVTYSDPSGHFPVWAAIGAVWGGYDGYKYAKRKRLHGWRKAGAIVGGAVLGVVNPFRRAGKAFKAARRVSRFVRKSRIAKGVSRCLRKTFRRTRIRRHIRRYAIKTVHAAKRVRCRVTRKGCFAAGTPIAVKNGFVPIEKIKAGDRVWSEDTRTGKKGLKKVKKIFVREKDSIIRLSINGEVTEATEEHPFFVKDIGWIPAGELNVGDLVKLQSGEFVPVEDYEVVQLDEPIKVYNFVVEDFHTYYVSGQKVLVHNTYQKSGGSYGAMRKKAKKGQEVHHIPQNAYNHSIGRSRNSGPAIIMSKRDHALTRTYRGRGRASMRRDAGLNARRRLAREARDIRKNFGRKYNSGLRAAIKYAKTLPEYRK